MAEVGLEKESKECTSADAFDALDFLLRPEDEPSSEPSKTT